MGSPISPIVANFFMEYFETKELASAQFRPKNWKTFVDDTCVVWPHRCEKLNLFLNHLNSQYDSIKFTMEVEVNGCLHFLNVLLSRMNDGSLSHLVFCTKTHTKQYLHSSSHHFLAQKFNILSTLATYTLRISNEKHLEEEKSHLLKFFENNGHSKSQGLKAFQRAHKESRVKPPHGNPISKVQLPFI